MSIALPGIHPPSEELEERALGSELLREATFLLVDDDDMVREVMRQWLEAEGCVVHEARNGAEALRAYAARGEAFDVVILDMVMPEMGGSEAFRRIREIQRDQPVIVYSGFAQDDNVKSMLATGGCRFIRKPFRSAEFVRLVNDVLASRAKPVEPLAQVGAPGNASDGRQV